MKTLLTVAIPTYNRPSEVKKRIHELSKIDSKLKSMIQILICDNGTDRIDLEKFSEYDLNITHKINSTNLGLGRNIEECITNSHGVYVWLLSDDDEIITENFESLCTTLVESSSDLIVFSDEGIDEHHQVVSGNEWFLSLIFLSAIVLKVEPAKKIVESINGKMLNPTYHQVLIGILVSHDSFNRTILKNEFVIDTLTHKNYTARASFTVRIGDLLLLEDQLRLNAIHVSILDRFLKLVNSHLFNYTAQIVAEFYKRSDYIYFVSQMIRYRKSSIHSQKRFLLYTSCTLIYLMGAIDFRISRVLCKIFFKQSGVTMSLIKHQSRNAKSVEAINDASREGYE